MPKLIDREASLKLCSDTHNPYHRIVREFLLTAPTVDAEPVRHGRWDEIQCFSEHGIEMASYECTSCGNDIERQRGLVPAYCEFCGAKMDGGADNG